MSAVNDNLVTILIPCNSIEYLKPCLESIHSQTYSNIEVLIVLNGDALQQKDFVESLCINLEIRFKILLSRANNITDALNEGISECNSEFIARMDADDVMLPERIATQVTILQNPEIVAVGAQIRKFDSKTKIDHPSYPLSDSEIRHCMFRYCALAHPTVMYRKTAVISAGGYSNRYPYIEDWYLWIRLLQKGKFFNINRVLIEYRLHENQSTMRYSQKQKESIKFFLRDNLRESVKAFVETYSVNSLRNFFRFDLIKQNGLTGLLQIRRSLAAILYLSKKSGRKTPLTIISLIVDPRLLYYFIKSRFL